MRCLKPRYYCSSARSTRDKENYLCPWSTFCTGGSMIPSWHEVNSQKISRGLLEELDRQTGLSVMCDFQHAEIHCCLLVCMGVQLGRSYPWKDIDWKCSRIGCWRRYVGLRGRKWQQAGANCIIARFMICTIHQILFGRSNQGACGMYGGGGGEKCVHDFGGGIWIN
jgi:hypothetical protein